MKRDDRDGESVAELVAGSIAVGEDRDEGSTSLSHA